MVKFTLLFVYNYARTAKEKFLGKNTNYFIPHQNVLHPIGDDPADRTVLPNSADGPRPPSRRPRLRRDGHRKDRDHQRPGQGRGQAVRRIQLLRKLPLWYKD
jgi:hypothetical protein